MSRSMGTAASNLAGMLTSVTGDGPAGDWTVAAWVSPDSHGLPSSGRLLETTPVFTATVRQQIRMGASTRAVTATQGHATSAAVTTTATVLSNSQWSCLVATYTAADNKTRLYSGLAATAMAEMTYASQVAGIGAQEAGGDFVYVGGSVTASNAWSGPISRVYFFDRVWTLSEMESYRIGVAPIPTSADWGVWDMSGPDGSTVIQNLAPRANVSLLPSGTVTSPEEPPVPSRMGGSALWVRADSGGTTPEPTFPGVTVEISFCEDAMGGGTWTDVTKFVRGIDITRGRQKELDKFESGTASVALDNRTRLFDVTNIGGPYYEKLLPLRRLRITAQDYASATRYPLFDGYVESWPLSYNPPADAAVIVQCADALSVLAAIKLPSTLLEATTLAAGPRWFFKLKEAEKTTSVAAEDAMGIYPATLTAPASGGSFIKWASAIGSLSFNGTTTLIALPAGAVPDHTASGGAFTFSCWVAPTPTAKPAATKYAIIASFKTAAGHWTIVGINSAGKIVASDSGGATAFITSADQCISLARHVMVTYSGGVLGLYVDGVHETTTTAALTAPANGGGWIGWSGDANVSYVRLGNCSVAAPAYFDRAMVAADSSEHADSGHSAYDNMLSGVQVTALLTLVGWPAPSRVVDYGDVLMQGMQFGEDTYALGYLQDIAISEGGALFVTADGRLRFRRKNAIATSPSYNTSQAFFGSEVSDALPFHKISFEEPLEFIYNMVRFSRKGGDEFEIKDEESRRRYFTRAIALSNLLVFSDSVLRDQAQYVLAQYLGPRLRINQMVLKPRGTQAMWPQVLGRELEDRVTVRCYPPGGGDPIVMDCHIQRIQHAIDPVKYDWTTGYYLAPADTGGKSLILDDTSQPPASAGQEGHFGYLDYGALGR